MVQRIETKVISAAGGAGAGGVVAGFLLWILGIAVWGAPFDAAGADKAVAAVPAPVSALVLLVISLAGAAIAGYLAPHTVRSDVHQPQHLANTSGKPERVLSPAQTQAFSDALESSKSDPANYRPDYALAPDKD